MGLEFAGIEFLVEVGPSTVCNAIEAAVNLDKQPILGELTAALAGVLPDRPTLGFDGRRC